MEGDFGFENGTVNTIVKFYYGDFTGPAGNVAVELLNMKKIMMDEFVKNRPHGYQIESKTMLTGGDAIRAVIAMALLFGKSVVYAYPNAFNVSTVPFFCWRGSFTFLLLE